MSCPDLSEPENVDIVYSDPIPRDVGSTATYSCTTAGYQLVGIMAMERMCGASGWSTGDDPTCICTYTYTDASLHIPLTPTALTVDPLPAGGTLYAGMDYSLTCTATVMGSTATPTLSFQWFQDETVITVGGTVGTL